MFVITSFPYFNRASVKRASTVSLTEAKTNTTICGNKSTQATKKNLTHYVKVETSVVVSISETRKNLII